MSEMSETTVNIRGDKQSTSHRIWSGLSMSAEYFDLLVALSLCTTNTIFIKELDQYQHKWVNFKTTSIYLTASKNKKWSRYIAWKIRFINFQVERIFW